MGHEVQGGHKKSAFSQHLIPNGWLRSSEVMKLLQNCRDMKFGRKLQGDKSIFVQSHETS